MQVNVFVNTYLATGQQEGAVSWLGYAFRLMYLPIGLFGVSIATASLPDISRHAVADDLRCHSPDGLARAAHDADAERAGDARADGAGGADRVAALRAEPIRPGRHRATAAALMFYAPGLLGYSAVKIASPTFYSLRDSRTPVIVSALSVAVNLALNLALIRVLGYSGLALGTALAAIFNAGVLLWLLHGGSAGSTADPWR